MNYWSCYILRIHSLRWNINLNNCVAPVHRNLTTPVKNSTAALQEEGETLASCFSLCIASVMCKVLQRKTAFPKFTVKCRNQISTLKSSSKLNQMGWAQVTGVPWTNFGGLDCISICYCSTFYERGARISHVLSGASPHEAGRLTVEEGSNSCYGPASGRGQAGEDHDEGLDADWPVEAANGTPSEILF